MKTKTVIVITLLTAGLGIGVVSTPANASNWHKGTPKILRGYWFNKEQDRLAVSDKGIYITPKVGAAVSAVRSVKYRYLGHQTYQYRQKFKASGSYTGKITISANHHYVKVSDVSGVFFRK